MNRLCVVVCTTLLAACAADVGPEDGLLDEDGSALVAKPDVVMNGIKHDDVVMNGLMFVPGNVQALRTWPLASETFRSGLGPPELTSLPCDTRTKKFMRYLIETALEPGQAVEFCGEKTEGAMGMHPKWHTNPATVEGQEAVTAGLMARTNAHGTPVMISPRGERPELAQFSINGPVPGDVFDSTPARKPIPSLHNGCSAGESGAGRNCGWSRDYIFVGTCTAGFPVDAGAGASPGCGAPLGWSVDDTVLRICTDEFGCDDGGLGWLKSADDTCGGREPATTFICPPSGVFTAMLSGVTESTPFDGAVGVTSGKPFAFPVKVKDFFKVEEGSVYGKMFDEKTHNPNIKVELKVGGKKNQVQYVIHVGKSTKEHTGIGSDRILFLEDSWAAPDPAWTDAEATLHGRFCLTNVPVQGPGGSSLENLCGIQVLDDAYVVPAEHPANFCNRFDQAPLLGDIDHDDCPDGLGNKRKWPLTIYLHDACDLLTPEQVKQGLCRRGRK